MWDVDARLYPDVAAAGSVWQALQAAFDAAGLPLRAGPDPAPGLASLGARLFNGQLLATVLLGPRERAFMLEFRSGATLVAHAATDDFGAAVAALHAWHSGRPVEQLATIVPALRPGTTGHGRGAFVEDMWQRYVELTGTEDGLRHLHPLLVAAQREPLLRELMPYLIGKLLLHRTVGYPPSADKLSVVPVDGGYRVLDRDDTDLGTADAAGAVALMLAALRARTA